MPEDRDLDQPDQSDDTSLNPEDDIVGIGDSDDDEEFDDIDDDEFDEGEEEPRGMEPTEEVGSEGGSPGESMGQSRSRIGSARGTEATETWEPSDRDRGVVDQRDTGGVPVRRSPI